MNTDTQGQNFTADCILFRCNGAEQLDNLNNQLT